MSEPSSQRRRATKAANRTCLIIRHADALSRSGWRGDDARRPLSPKGERQATAIATKLAASGVARILSSPAERCVATVAPLALALSEEVERVDFLAEGSDAGAALGRLIEEAVSLDSKKAMLVACRARRRHHRSAERALAIRSGREHPGERSKRRRARSDDFEGIGDGGRARCTLRMMLA